MASRAFYEHDLAEVQHGSFHGHCRRGRRACGGTPRAKEPGARHRLRGRHDGVRTLKAAGHEVIGVDQSPDLVLIARRKHPGIQFEVGDDARPLPLDGKFDAVLAIGEVLAYVGERNAAELAGRFAQLLARLRPGGFLLFDLPSPDRVDDLDQHNWTSGEEWTVLSATSRAGELLRRTIVTFRRQPSGDYRRTEEIHDLELHAVERCPPRT